jgi:hypothetical protein
MSLSRRGGKGRKEGRKKRRKKKSRILDKLPMSMRGRKTRAQEESGSRIPTPLPVAMRIPKSSSWKSSSTWRKP